MPALNDSKYIGICVYNVLIMCSAGASIAFIVESKRSAYLLITLFIFVCTMITLCLVFLPKVFEVRKDPQGKFKPAVKKNLKKPSTAITIASGHHLKSSSNSDSKKSQQHEFQSNGKDAEKINKKINDLIEDNKKKTAHFEKVIKKIVSLFYFY